MTNILEIAKMNAAPKAPKAPKAPEPTEKAQIAIHYREPHPSLVFRFSTVKKAETEYGKLIAAWKKRTTDFHGSNALHYVNADMFYGWVDIDAIAAAMLIDHKKYGKFVPVAL